MRPQDFQDYGPMRRRGRTTKPGDMATPYTGPTVSMPVIRRGGPPSAQAPRSHGRAWAFLLVLLLLGGVGGGTYAGLRYLDQRYSGRILPNVAVQGVDLTEKTPEEATQLVRERFAPFLAKPVSFEYAGRIWEPSAEEIGVRVNVDEQITAAMHAGRDNGLFRNIVEVWRTYQNGLDLPLTVSVDGPRLQAYVGRIAAELEQPPVEAELGIDAVTAAINHVESREGRMALLDVTVEDVLARLPTLEPHTAPLHLTALKPSLTSAHVAEAKRTIEAMTQGPMKLRFKQQDKSFELPRDEIAHMIVLTRTQGIQGPVLNAQLDQKQLRKWVTGLADSIGRDSIEPRVDWNGGNPRITQPGRSAYRLDLERALILLNETIIGNERTLELPVEEVQPRVTEATLATLGLKELVAEGKSDFTGSAAYRITNIRVGAQLMHGILVPPDGEFSFNENVGAIDASQGFVDGYAIVGNRTQLEPGGGICQVSTTLFRAAFYAGLPFSDWTPHRFRISWYEKYDTIGMDSTIYTGGGPDLRFVNDTGNWLLIQSTMDEANASLTFSLYGTKVPGREVVRSEAIMTNQSPPPAQPVYIDDPKQPVGTYSQSDTARGGLDIRIDRTVLQNGQVVHQRSFITSFQPWPNIFVKNPNTPLPPGGKLGNS